MAGEKVPYSSASCSYFSVNTSPVKSEARASYALAGPPAPVPSSFDEDMEGVEDDGVGVSKLQPPNVNPPNDHSSGADDTMVQDGDPDVQSDGKAYSVSAVSGHRELSISQPVEAASEKQSLPVVTVDGQIDAEETTSEELLALRTASKQGMSDKENASPIVWSTPKKDVQGSSIIFSNLFILTRF